MGTEGDPTLCEGLALLCVSLLEARQAFRV